MAGEFQIDALLPADMAAKAEQVGVRKANLKSANMFVNNLIPVTIGNIIGGAIMVGVVYWFIYLRPQRQPKPEGHSKSIGSNPASN